MREALGNTFVFYVVIVFIIIIMIFLVGSLSYSRGFKAKNRIIDIIEENKGYDDDAVEEIDQILHKIGYRTASNTGRKECPEMEGATSIGASENYFYCVYEFPTERGIYYHVKIYMHFDIPVISSFIEIPVSGDTATIFEL